MNPEGAVGELLRSVVQRARERRCLPEATYRLQFHAGFTFQDAVGITGYLHDLGISHCYASPYLKARPGSTHGYDIVDHGTLNPEVGSREDYEAFVAALKQKGLGQIVDTVPNHMGVGTNENAWWNDVLENGPASRFGTHFDISWRSSPRPELQNKVLLPVLGEPYGEVLEKGQLKLAFDAGAFSIQYYDRRFPVAPRSYCRILGQRAEELSAKLGADSPALLEYQSICTAARNLPDRSETEPASVAERNREKEVIKRRLSALSADNGQVREFIDRNVALFNSGDDARGFDLLDDLLEHQCYRLAYWRVAPDEINYRRFFDINDLAALSMELPEVFEAAHNFILNLLVEDKIDGLRIDHPDGLYDPEQYFHRLQEYYLLTLARHAFDSNPGRFNGIDWPALEPYLREQIGQVLPARGSNTTQWPLYVVAEKILGAEEPLVETWAVDGTSGYDFVNVLNGLFVDTRNARAFTHLYQELTEDDTSYGELVYRKKLLILSVSLASELHMLTYQLDRLAQKSRNSRDFTFNILRRALREVIACFPVYRSYIAADGVHEEDRRHIEKAIRRASSRNPLLGSRVFGFIRDMLLMKSPPSFSEEDRAEQLRFAGKFQQVTAPVTAKGIEDTAFYIYNRLISLNEVGGEPGVFGIEPEKAHRYNQDRQAQWPYALNPLSTHDTKRSEDVRARINVLSEMPDEWHQAVKRWRKSNEPHRQQSEGVPIPDANEEYLLYQSLIGAWPLEPYSPGQYEAFVERIQAYMEKALHEAKVHTSWINPNEDYDRGVREFIDRVLHKETNRAFIEDFQDFQRRISHYGLFNSLSQTLLRLTSPGVPDTYQGTELWDFSLVDPDNRRPVDYDRRKWFLGELQAAAANASDQRGLVKQLLDTRQDGRIKLYTTYRTLHARRDYPRLFSAGEYLSLSTAGDRASHLFAFARRLGDQLAIVAVPRLLVRLDPSAAKAPLGNETWQNTVLQLGKIDPGQRWRDVFTGVTLTASEQQGNLNLSAADLFADFPVALLVGERS